MSAFSDGGGFYIDANGIHPVPIWEPKVKAALDAVAKLVRVKDAGVEIEVERLGTDLLEIAAKELGAREGSLAYFSADGDGFFCGSIGPRPPFPLPIPLGEREQRFTDLRERATSV